jgi:hypothetical protein
MFISWKEFVKVLTTIKIQFSKLQEPLEFKIKMRSLFVD